MYFCSLVISIISWIEIINVPLGLQTLLHEKHCSTPLIRDYDSPLLLDPKEDARLQPPMTKTDSGVDGGNYCMVLHSATKLASGVNIKTSLIKLDYLYTTP